MRVFSTPSTLIVSENNDAYQVCVVLLALESTERDFIVKQATSDGTGMETVLLDNNIKIIKNFLKVWLVLIILVFPPFKLSHLDLTMVLPDV